jgi:hypothetical protein
VGVCVDVDVGVGDDIGELVGVGVGDEGVSVTTGLTPILIGPTVVSRPWKTAIAINIKLNIPTPIKNFQTIGFLSIHSNIFCIYIPSGFG